MKRPTNRIIRMADLVVATVEEFYRLAARIVSTRRRLIKCLEGVLKSQGYRAGFNNATAVVIGPDVEYGFQLSDEDSPHRPGYSSPRTGAADRRSYARSAISM